MALGRDFTAGVFLELLQSGYRRRIATIHRLSSSPNPSFHPSEDFLISTRFFPFFTTVQRLHESLQCFDVIITDINIKWAQPASRCPPTSLSTTLGHILLLETSDLFSVRMQTKRNRCLALRRHEGLEGDGSVKLTRSQSLFAAGSGGIVHKLGLGNGPVSLCSGHWRSLAGTKAGGAVDAWKNSWILPTGLEPRHCQERWLEGTN